jgi:regulation of enolase protein 1 (concanavalin A-like superfamily)
MLNSFDNSLNPCKITNTDTGFHLVANAKTDFICKYKEYIKDEAAFFFIEKTGDFTIKAEVETKGNFAYDAAFLINLKLVLHLEDLKNPKIGLNIVPRW